MALNYQSGGLIQDSNWPMPSFYFQVQIDEFPDALGFQKVTGLEAKTNFVSYSHGNSLQPYDYNIPGRTVFSDVTLEKGIFSGDTDLFQWWKNNLIEAKPSKVQIFLLNEDGDSEMSWVLDNAIPVQITFGELDSQKKGGPAIEKLVMKYSNLEIISLY
jgi:phage tail-like protein|tara:strand:- start:7853 stop:8329 length:477 start_codon:yes stop_codon:yes gene_type:complete